MENEAEIFSQGGLFWVGGWGISQGDIILKELWSVLEADARKSRSTMLLNSLA